MDKSEKSHNPLNNLNKTVLEQEKNSSRPYGIIFSIIDDERGVTDLSSKRTSQLSHPYVVCSPRIQIIL